MLFAIRHSITVEYVLERLGHFDPESPHDLSGEGNKFEWEVMAPLAAAQNKPDSYWFPYVADAIDRHRAQVHHYAWRNPEDPGDLRGMTLDHALALGAADSIVSLLEERYYQGGPHPLDELKFHFNGNSIQREYVDLILPEIKGMQLPDVASITSLDDIHRFGLSGSKYSKIVTITEMTRGYLRKEHGYAI